MNVAGVVGGDLPQGLLASWLSRMLDGVAPREPAPAQRAWCSGGVLGCSARVADGPAIARAGTWTVLVDGTIYDADPGGAARSAADVFAGLFVGLGVEESLSRVNGDFAIAAYDAATRQLFLARDRFGVRPLYHATHGVSLAFASRPAMLTALPWVAPDPDPGYLGRYALGHYRLIDQPLERSAYRDVAQVRAGHVVTWHDGRLSARRYWRPLDEPDEPDDAGDASELAVNYRDLLLDSVALRTSGERRVAFTLSGGLDSTSVLSCAVQVRGLRQPALSATYDDPTYDESAIIREVEGDLADPWHEVPIDGADLFETIGRMLAVHDEPVATVTWLAHFMLCRRAAALGYDTLLGGLGGDEVNAGEYEYFPYFFADLLAAGRAALYEREVACWAMHHDHPVYRKTPSAAAALVCGLTDGGRPGICRSAPERRERYREAIEPELREAASAEEILEHPFRSCLKNRTWQDLTCETLPCCLRAQDRNGRAFGIEHRLPFLDHRVVSLLYRVDGQRKIRDGVTKVLLREAMDGIVPASCLRRVRKIGWNAPAHRWFASTARDSLLDLVSSRSFRERGIYRVPVVERIIDEHAAIVESGRAVEHHMMFLWQLVNLELWLRRLDGGRPMPEPVHEGVGRLFQTARDRRM